MLRKKTGVLFLAVLQAAIAVVGSDLQQAEPSRVNFIRTHINTLREYL